MGVFCEQSLMKMKLMILLTSHLVNLESRFIKAAILSCEAGGDLILREKDPS